MPRQPVFPGFRDVVKKKVTQREKFPSGMGAGLPWGRLLTLIAPPCLKAGPRP